jgi:hypothetical protein
MGMRQKTFFFEKENSNSVGDGRKIKKFILLLQHNREEMQ